MLRPRPMLKALRWLSLAFVLIAAALPGSNAAAQTTATVIRVGTGPDPATTPILYGVQAGIYKRYGLTVQPTLLRTGAAAMAAVSGGSLEIGKNSAVGVLTAISKGVPYTVLGAMGYYDASQPNYALLVPEKSTIRTPKDLEHKTFASLSLFDQNSVATRAWLEAHGVDASTIKYVEIPPSAALAAMQSHRIDAVTVFEPFLSQDVQSGEARILGYPYDAIARHFPDTLLFANRAWVDAHRDDVVKFLRATQEAAEYVQAHEQETAPLLARFLALDPAKVHLERWPQRGVTLSAAELQPVIDAAAKYKVLPSAIPAQEVLCSCALPPSSEKKQ